MTKIVLNFMFRSRLILLQENNEKQEDRLAKVKQIFDPFEGILRGLWGFNNGYLYNQP